MRKAALIVLFVSVVHDLDHVRQGTGASAEVVATAIAGWIATIALLALVFRGHRLAAPYAVTFGLALAAGFVLVHFLPHWSAFSAPYPDQDVDALSWLLAALPVAAGLGLTAVALGVVSPPGRPSTARRSASRPARTPPAPPPPGTRP